MTREYPQKINYPTQQYQVGNRLFFIAEPEQWLTYDQKRMLFAPLDTMHSESCNQKRRNNWWGLYHRSDVVVTPDRTVSRWTNLLSPAGVRFTRNELKRHTSQWDEQAIPLSGILQCDLEVASYEKGEVIRQKIASLLIGSYDRQRLTLHNNRPTGGIEWYAPKGIFRHLSAEKAVKQMLLNSMYSSPV